MNPKALHTFVICAYRESPYLETCIRSLRRQTLKSRIIMVTSTPNDHIRKMSEKYRIPCIVNEGEGGITQDWNFGYAQAETKYMTIAHQDDYYAPAYLEKVLPLMEKADRPLIAFTDYFEIREKKKVNVNKLLTIKRMMLFPLRSGMLQKSVRVRRFILSLGCPICCPSVTYAKDHLPEQVFRNGYRSCEDWEAWEMISKRKGTFVYCPEKLVGHRIHEDSATTAIIGDNARTGEELEMYRKFMPDAAARLMAHFYADGQKSNQLHGKRILS